MFPYSRPDRSERRVGDLDRLHRALFRVTLATVCKPGIIEVRDYNHFVLFYLYFFDVLKNSFHVIEDLNQKNVFGLMSRRLYHFCRRNSIQVFEFVFSQEIGILEFSRIISLIFFFIYTLFKYLLAPLCKLKLLLAQGLSQHLSLLGIFSVVWGIEAVLDLLFSLVG